MAEHVVTSADELDEGDRMLVELEGREVAVFNVGGDYYAYTNWCAHQSGPVCEGALSGTWEATFDRKSLKTSMEWCADGEVLTCPWHGWEYDIESGESLSNGSRLPSHDVTVEDGDVVVSI